MIKVLFNYLRQEAGPRYGEILKGFEFWIAMILGVVVIYFGGDLLSGFLKIRVVDISEALLTYSAIGLGFCLAGLTLVLTLPDREFSNKLVSSKLENKKHDAYSDLLFVFSWTAFLHWLCIVIIVVFLISYGGGEDSVLSVGSSQFRRCFVGLIVFIAVYCFGQFLITLITLSQFGRVYIDSLKENNKKKIKG
jgi:hypothetical protein